MCPPHDHEDEDDDREGWDDMIEDIVADFYEFDEEEDDDKRQNDDYYPLH